MIKKNARFNYLLLIYLAGMVMFTLFRIAEAIVYSSQVSQALDSRFWHALWIGLRFDTVVSGYILALPLLMMVIGEVAHIQKHWYYAIAHYYMMVLYSVSFMASAADIPYFCYFFQHLDAQVLTLGSSFSVVVDMIVSEPSYLIFLFIFLAIATGWWLLGKLIYKRVLKAHLDQRLPSGWAVGLSVVLLLCCFAGMRGRLCNNPPLRVGDSVYCSNPFLNQIGITPMFTFVKSAQSIMSEPYTPIELVDLATARQEFANREASPATDSCAVSLPKGTNVVLVIMESMATEKTSLGTNPAASLTPHLDSIMRSGITFTKAWSAGTQTFNGVYSTLYAHPAIFKRHTMHNPVVPLMCGLPQMLQTAGYSTAYFMPHMGCFDGMETFLPSNGFEHIYEQTCYPEEEWLTSYGVPDHVLFRHALEYMNEAAKEGPFFTTVMTCSDHPPYVLPEGIDFHPRSEELTHQITEYADWSIGWFLAEAAKQPWFDNTVFVFLGDHGASYGAPVYDILLTRNRIPIIIYAPGRIEPKAIDRPACQIDVAPTVLGMLGIQYPNTMIGIDVLHHQRKYAFFGYGNMIGATDGELLYIYRDDSKVSSLYNYKELSTDDISDRLPKRKEAMERYAKSMVQMSYQMLNDGTTDCEKAQ